MHKRPQFELVPGGFTQMPLALKQAASEQLEYAPYPWPWPTPPPTPHHHRRRTPLPPSPQPTVSLASLSPPSLPPSAPHSPAPPALPRTPSPLTSTAGSALRRYHMFMGLFPQIHRAWMTIDHMLFLWDYTDPRGSFYQYDGLDP